MVTSHTPRLSDRAPPSSEPGGGQLQWNRNGAEELPYRPRHAARAVGADSRGENWAKSATPLRRGRHTGRGQLYRPASRVHGLGLHDVIEHSRAAEDAQRQRQLDGINALLALASATAVTHPLPVLPLAPATRPDVASAKPGMLAVLTDPALRGALALILSAAMSGVLGFVFWVLTAHKQSASAVGSVSAEVSAIMFLASVGSLSLSNVFARFLPEAGWDARRLILLSYGGALLAGSIVATIFLLTPLARGLVLGGGFGRLAFAVCVVLNSVFMIQDGGLIGFGRSDWVPIENILVALARLALLPLATTFLSAPIGILWSWAIPMGIAVVMVNALLIGPLAGRSKQCPDLPPPRELGRFVAVDSVTIAVTAAVTAFLPALITRRFGASQGGYFYVPWIITTMVSLLLSSIMISMVREAVARPEKANFTIRRSLGLVLLVVTMGTAGCLFLSPLVLAPLGPEFVVHGVPLLHWAGLALPAMAVNLLYWATCLVRRRPWPMVAVNLATSAGIIGGVLLLKYGANLGRVGNIYCLVQWTVAVIVAIPAYRALRTIGNDKK